MMSASNGTQTAAEARVDPAEYTEDYYLSSCEGFQAFQDGGRALSARMERAMELAVVRPGERLLDVGCGRGELVLEAARRRAHGLGIDYAPVAARLARSSIARQAPSSPGSASVGQMDATKLGLESRSFDAILMLDVVEHLYPRELERAVAEALRVLRPGGRLVIHTSPNRTFEQVVWPYYVRNVHRAALAVARRFNVQSPLFNRLMLPTDRLPPHDEYERRLHVNEQTAGRLRALLANAGFDRIAVDHWEPPAQPFFDSRRLNLQVRLLDVVRFLWPLGRVWPLDGFFSNHIWVTARRPKEVSSHA
jgi:SAM-dependent methyltransferase